MVKYPSDNDATQNIEIIIIIKNIYEKIIFFDFLSELSEYLMLTAEKSRWLDEALELLMTLSEKK